MSSPKATGGAGTHFESRVAAYYLAATLSSSAVRGLPEGVGRQVQLQRAFAGQPLDDVIVRVDLSTGDVGTLSLQAKRQFHVSTENEIFVEVLGSCWKTFSNPDFRWRRDRFGVAFSVYSSKADNHYQSVLSWARQSADSADFFARLNNRGTSHESARSFVGSIREALRQAAGTDLDDHTVWRFLSGLVLLHFDFETADASRDQAHALELCARTLTPGTPDRPAELWFALLEEADLTAATAGSLDRAALIAKLGSRFQFGIGKNCIRDVHRLAVEACHAMADIDADIGGVHFDRLTILDEVDAALSQADCVEIVGEPGVGKSAILKALAERQLSQGPVLFLKHDRLALEAGWAGQAQLWSLENNLTTLLVELGTASRPCIFIDGIDRVSESSAWTIINDLLREALRPNPAPRFQLVVTARSTALDYRVRLDSKMVSALHIRRVVVSTLQEAEVTALAAAHPTLAPLIRRAGPARMLAAVPYFLQRLLRLSTAETTSGGPITEVDLMKYLWSPPDAPDQAMVRRRQDVLAELAHRKLADPGRPIRSDRLDAEALVGLVADGTLREDGVRRTVAFTHDILEDWVLCWVLDREGDRIGDVLVQYGQPLWLVDAVQLLAAWRLERSMGTQDWTALLTVTEETRLEPRWSRAVLSAPLRSARSLDLFQRLEQQLWSHDGALLARMLTALRVSEVIPNHDFLDPKRLPDLSDSERLRLAYDRGHPRISVWHPFLVWLAEKLDAMPPSLLWEVSLIVEMWQRVASNQDVLVSRKLVDFTSRWLDRLERRHDTPEIDDRTRKAIEAIDAREDDSSRYSTRSKKTELINRLRSIVLESPRDAQEYAFRYLEHLTNNRASDEAIEQVVRSLGLAGHYPSILVDFCLRVLIKPIPADVGSAYTSSSFDLNRLGIDEQFSLFYPASHLQPPFRWLLEGDAGEGLRLINGLCNHAMAVWRAVYSWEGRGTPIPLKLRFPWGERTFWGHGREYTWNRGIGPGPHAACSALMALEAWMEKEVAGGRDCEDVFRQALEGNQCVGAVGACVAIALQFPERSLGSALPFVTSPLLWRWDLQRQMKDTSASNSNIIGDWSRYGYLLRPVRDRNQLPHRRGTLRDLSALYMMMADDAIQGAFVDGVSRFVENPPFEFEEEKSNHVHAEEQRRLMVMWSLLGNPKNWGWEEIDGHRSFGFIAPPELEAERAPARAEREAHARLLRLVLWAEKSFEQGRPSDDLEMSDALDDARELDAPDLFESPQNPFDYGTYARGAVAGVAAVAARFMQDMPEDVIRWCEAVLLRAAKMPVLSVDLLSRSSVSLYHPTAFAARGLASLVGRGKATGQIEETLLRLVAHPNYSIMETAVRALSEAWTSAPLLCWQAGVLGMRRTLLPHSIRELWGKDHDQVEAQHTSDAFELTREEFREGSFGSMPKVPLPWSKHTTTGGGGRPIVQYREAELLFQWDIASKVLFSLPSAELLLDARTGASFRGIVECLLAWTIAEWHPTWRNVHSGSGRPYEWTGSFLRWCAQLTSVMRVEEVNTMLLRPLKDAQWEVRWHLFADFMSGFVSHRFSQDHAPTQATVTTWRALCRIVFDADRAALGDQQDYDRCTALVLFCGSGSCYFSSPWSSAAAVLEIVEEWVARYAERSGTMFRVLLAFLDGAGWEWMPAPALTWLETVVNSRRGTLDFWNSSDVPGVLATLLERLWREKGAEILRLPDVFAQLSRIVDFLLSCGVGLAAKIQQDIALASEGPTI